MVVLNFLLNRLSKSKLSTLKFKFMSTVTPTCKKSQNLIMLLSRWLSCNLFLFYTFTYLCVKIYWTLTEIIWILGQNCFQLHKENLATLHPLQAYFTTVKIFRASKIKPWFWDIVYYMQYTAPVLSYVSSTSYLFVSETE